MRIYCINKSYKYSLRNVGFPCNICIYIKPTQISLNIICISCGNIERSVNDRIIESVYKYLTEKC